VRERERKRERERERDALQAKNYKSTMSVIKYYCDWVELSANSALCRIIAVIMLVPIPFEFAFLCRQATFCLVLMKTRDCGKSVNTELSNI
jgi:hypothetical protein